MREKTFTCPFTGCAFSATVDTDENMIFANPVTGKVEHVRFDPFMRTYNVPKELFEHVETVSLGKTAEILDVSRQRATQLAQDDVIPAKTVNGQTVFVLSDVLKYKETRKPGAPRKDVRTCEA